MNENEIREFAARWINNKRDDADDVLGAIKPSEAVGIAMEIDRVFGERIGDLYPTEPGKALPDKERRAEVSRLSRENVRAIDELVDALRRLGR